MAPSILRPLRALPGVRHAQLEAGRLTLGLDDLSLQTAAVLQALADAGVKLRNLSSDRANLEDVFLALTGRQLRD